MHSLKLLPGVGSGVWNLNNKGDAAGFADVVTLGIVTGAEGVIWRHNNAPYFAPFGDNLYDINDTDVAVGILGDSHAMLVK